MDHIRNKERNHVISFVKVTLDHPDQHTGRVIDISSAGVRLRSRKKIEPNVAFRFSVMIPNINYRKKVIEFDGVVVWSCQSDQEDYFDCGIQVTSISDKDKEIVEQFIKDSSHRDRWIAVSECFAQEY